MPDGLFTLCEGNGCLLRKRNPVNNRHYRLMNLLKVLRRTLRILRFVVKLTK